MHGTVARFSRDRGFGFIAPDEAGPDVFLHARELVSGTEDELVPGARVSYDVGRSPKGDKAVRVTVLGTPEPGEPAGDWRAEITALANDHMQAFLADLDRLLGSWG